ncbi:MAG: anthranilate synthase component I [Gemmataceae bacterium]|nr:anthranilate synthase component I [Gemmataceae bacterium]
MNHQPSFDSFKELANAFTLVPVYRQLVADTLTPVSAFYKIATDPWSFLFESVVGGERVGRYSFLGADPFLHFSSSGNQITIREKGSRSQEHFTEKRFENANPLRVLEELLGKHQSPHLPGLPRFSGGAVGYAGYDTIRYVENLPNTPADDRNLPDLSFAFYDRMVIFDQINKTVAVVAHAHVDPKNLLGSYESACSEVNALVDKLRSAPCDLKMRDVQPLGPVTRKFDSNFTREQFINAVKKCKEYIFAGDIFQVVLSQRLETETHARPFDIYRTLRVVNPSPFLFYLRQGDLALIGSSPEIMVRVEGRQVTIRPLAGTRPRGQTDAEDKELAEELVNDPKERAEHIMLVDLGRNDVGRVAEFGSVTISDVMTVEKYSHVMHLCSTVEGTLAKDKTPFDALRSCLPAGTLSGAPKVRAMEIIDELETTKRGPYGGAVGYIDFSGNMDTCIALRTLVLTGKKAYLQAGAGVVADSDPDKEYEETLNKAKGLLKAIEMAETQL